MILCIGDRVKTLEAFVEVPKGSTGVVVCTYDGGVMIRWEPPVNKVGSRWPLEDGFSEQEFEFLEKL